LLGSCCCQWTCSSPFESHSCPHRASQHDTRYGDRSGEEATLRQGGSQDSCSMIPEPRAVPRALATLQRLQPHRVHTHCHPGIQAQAHSSWSAGCLWSVGTPVPGLTPGYREPEQSHRGPPVSSGTCKWYTCPTPAEIRARTGSSRVSSLPRMTR
jgi:hypothetical protein